MRRKHVLLVIVMICILAITTGCNNKEEEIEGFGEPIIENTQGGENQE